MWFRASLEQRPPDDLVRVTAWAEVTDLFLTHDLDAMLALSEMYAWSEDYIRMRMAYKPRKPMNVVLVRAFRLPRPLDIPILDHFAGCKSWVPLDTAVTGPDLERSQAVLSDEEHASRVATVAATFGADAERLGV